MAKEIELNVYNVSKEQVEKRLKELNAKHIGRHSFKRINFQLPSPTPKKPGETSWLRLRTDGEKTTMTFKEQKGTEMSQRYEAEIEVDDFIGAVNIILKILPGTEYDYFENERDEYELDGVHITIDKFPRLPHTMEIEGPSEKAVYDMLERIGIKGEKIETTERAVPTGEYYAMHGVDYMAVQKEYKAKLEDMLSMAKKK